MPNRVKFDTRLMLSRCAKIRAQLPYAAGGVLFDEVKDVEIPEMKRRVPKDTRDLESTIRVEGPAVSGKTIQVAVLAGGMAKSGREVDYAIPVHEDLEMHHPRGGEAKYIESVLLESKSYLAARVAKRGILERIEL